MQTPDSAAAGAHNKPWDMSGLIELNDTRLRVDIFLSLRPSSVTHPCRGATRRS